MKKIIVTGGSGFIGSNLVKYLLNKNKFVINVDKINYSSNKDNLKPKKNYRFYKIDINNQKKMMQIIKKHNASLIINLAAETHVDRSIDSPKNFLDSNILGVYNILEILRKNKNIKLLHISTDEVYGDIKKNKRSDEKFPYNPSSPYSATKASADHLIKSYIRTFKIKAMISNCCNNYGPYQFPEKLIPKIILNILDNKELPIYAKGKNIREWIYVKDHCEAIYKIANKGKNGESYNVGSGININNINLVKKILRLFKLKKIKLGNKVKIKYVSDRPGHDLRYSLNSKKISKKLRWKCKISLSEGLSNTLDWYLKNKKNYRNKKSHYLKRKGKN